jgi:hypothetical protein
MGHPDTRLSKLLNSLVIFQGTIYILWDLRFSRQWKCGLYASGLWGGARDYSTTASWPRTQQSTNLCFLCTWTFFRKYFLCSIKNTCLFQMRFRRIYHSATSSNHRLSTYNLTDKNLPLPRKMSNLCELFVTLIHRPWLSLRVTEMTRHLLKYWNYSGRHGGKEVISYFLLHWMKWTGQKWPNST